MKNKKKSGLFLVTNDWSEWNGFIKEFDELTKGKDFNIRGKVKKMKLIGKIKVASGQTKN